MVTTRDKNIGVCVRTNIEIYYNQKLLNVFVRQEAIPLNFSTYIYYYYQIRHHHEHALTDSDVKSKCII